MQPGTLMKHGLREVGSTIPSYIREWKLLTYGRKNDNKIIKMKKIDPKGYFQTNLFIVNKNPRC